MRCTARHISNTSPSISVVAFFRRTLFYIFFNDFILAFDNVFIVMFGE